MSEMTIDNKSESVQTSSVKTKVTIGAGEKLILADIKSVAQQYVVVFLNAESLPVIQLSKEYLTHCVEQSMPIYGVNTNFGDQVSFLDKPSNNPDHLPTYESIRFRQENLIRSMACSAGDVLPAEMVRAAMLLRAHCIAQGYSGINLNVVKCILDFLNAGITPVVRRYGSIGASGDLIPLASIAAAYIGENVEVWYQNQIMPATKAMASAGLSPLKLELRDGLALINGTSFMTGIAGLAVYKLRRLFHQMLSAIAMSLEAMLVISSGYHPLVHQLKNQAGEMRVNEFLNNFWHDSQLLSDLDELRHANMDDKKNSAYLKPVQDYYSLRSVAQGFGPFHENLSHAVNWVENEMNSVNDNPIIDAIKKEIHHGANFMGYYITDSCDILKMNISQASTWLHALLANMVHPRKNHQLPTNLVEDPGKNNGFRSLQLLAAALAVQNRKLAQSHQSYTLPTEGDNQDVNSLGTHAAQDLYEAVANLETLTAIQFLAAAQALEIRGIDKASSKAQSIYKIIRRHSSTITQCRPMSEELREITALLATELF